MGQELRCPICGSLVSSEEELEFCKSLGMPPQKYRLLMYYSYQDRVFGRKIEGKAISTEVERKDTDEGPKHIRKYLINRGGFSQEWVEENDLVPIYPKEAILTYENEYVRMKYCPHCGEPVMKGWGFCGSCGESTNTELKSGSYALGMTHICPHCVGTRKVDYSIRDPIVVKTYNKKITHCIYCGYKLVPKE